MSDYTEYQAAAHRATDQADAMIADVQALRDAHRAAADNTSSWWRADRHRSRADVLDQLLRKWATYPCTGCGEPIHADRDGLDDHEQRVCASCKDEWRGSYKPEGLA